MTEPTAADREFLGRLVRLVWIEWAKEQPNPKPSWLQSWEELTEPEREVDRRIGEHIAAVAAVQVAFDDTLRAQLAQSTSRAARLESAIQEVDAMLSRPDWPSWMRVLELTALMARLYDELGVPS